MNLHSPRVSLRTKIALPVAATLLGLGLGAAAMVRTTVQGALAGELHQRSLALVSEVSLRATQETLVEDLAGLDAVVQDAATRQDVAYVVIVGSSGYILADSFPAGVPDDLIGIFETRRETIDDVVPFRSEQGVVHDYVAQMIGGRLGTVHVGIAQTRIREQAVRQGRTVLLLLAAAAVFAALLAWIVAHLATSPLRKLSETASRVGDGDWTVRSDVRTSDEVGDLAVRFDEMIGRLEASRRVLEATHQGMVRTERMAMVGKVSSGIAHEIGNPLHAARQFAEALRENPGQHERYLPLIQEALHRIDKVIGQMLGFSRERRLEPRPVDINEVVARAADFLGYDKRSRDVTFDIDLAPGLPLVVADPDALSQVVINLLVNALDAVDGTGRIQIQTKTHHNGGPRPYVVVSVSDDGPGIPTAVAEQIFDPFFTTKEAGKGTGLGLSVSQELLSVQGGRIELRPGANAGATFEVWLPAGEGV